MLLPLESAFGNSMGTVRAISYGCKTTVLGRIETQITIEFAHYPVNWIGIESFSVVLFGMTQISFYIQTEVNKGRAHLWVIHEEFWHQSILLG